jgi:DNA-binding beta-propeller fold protein YncE
MTFRRCALLVVGLAVAGCDDDEGPPPVGLTPGTEYLVVAHGLSEDWRAVDLGTDSLLVAAGQGLLGLFPNDCDVAGETLYAVNSGDNSISVVDLPSGRSLGTIGLGAGTNPWEFLVDPADGARGWVTALVSGEVLELDLAGRRVRRRAAVGPAAEGLWVTDDRVIVTLTGSDLLGSFGASHVVALEKTTLTETSRVEVPANAQVVLSGADGRLHVICTGDYGAVMGRAVRMAADLGAVTDTLELGGTPWRAARHADGTVYVTSYFGGILAYDSSSFTLLRDVSNPLRDEPGFGGIAVRGDTILVVNFERDSVMALRHPDGALLVERRLGDGPVACALYDARE